MSKAAALLAPSSVAIVVAMAGVCEQVRDRRDDHRVDLAGLDARTLDRLAGGRDRHHLDRLVRRGPATLGDAGARPDPLVGGVDVGDDLGVVDDRRGR